MASGYYVLDRKDYPEIARLTGVDLDRPYTLGMLAHLWGWLLVLLVGRLASPGASSHRDFAIHRHARAAASHEAARRAPRAGATARPHAGQAARLRPQGSVLTSLCPRSRRLAVTRFVP